ncbi:MAG: molybdenum cofactor guanylyltransferase [Burkholderiales bacterium]|jgi:molybdopterin-guanine dinucleotide biosynthesis protein A|nr:molybdenum cofactor guanylyltransferase [Burkholderiales bacterium]
MISPSPDQLTAVILAGGMGRRMMNRDKGLILFQGRPLIAQVIERIRPQADHLIINANRHLEEYRAYGYPVVPDLTPDFSGPLSGLLAGLTHARTDWVITVPCDAPFLPLDLASRLTAAIMDHATTLAFAQTASRAHPTFALVHRSSLPDVAFALRHHQRRLGEFYRDHQAVTVMFDDELFFHNINTPEDVTSTGKK